MTGRMNRLPAVVMSRRRAAPAGEIPDVEGQVSSAIIFLCRYGLLGWRAARSLHLRGGCPGPGAALRRLPAPAPRLKPRPLFAVYSYIQHLPILLNLSFYKNQGI